MAASRLALLRLCRLGSDLGVMDLARQLGVNAAAVTRQVQELERERLVRRRADPKDGRRSYVSLSSKGKGSSGDHDRSHELERSLSSVISARRWRLQRRFSRSCARSSRSAQRQKGVGHEIGAEDENTQHPVFVTLMIAFSGLGCP